MRRIARLLPILQAVIALSLFAQTDSTERFAAEDRTEPDRSLRITLTPGITARITPGFEPDSTVDSRTGGPGAILRLMVVPEHALSVGIESGFITIMNARESEGTENSTVPEQFTLTAIPVLLTLAMGNERFEIGGGIGYFDLIATTKGENQGLNFQSHAWEIGFMVNALYRFPLGERFDLGPSLRLYNLADRPVTVLMLGADLQMRAFDL